MLALIIFLAYQFVALIIILLRLIRPQSGYFWLITAIGNLVIIPLFIILRFNLPGIVSVSNFGLQVDIPITTSILVDSTSWSFAFALAVISLASVLTDVARPGEGNWATWAVGMVLTGMGILALFSGNPLTILLAWVAVDFAEALVFLGQGYGSREMRPIILIFSLRIAGCILVLIAILQAAAIGMELTFDNISRSVSGFLLMGAFVRLSVLFIYPVNIQALAVNRSFGTMMRFIPGITSLLLVVRVANVGVAEQFTDLFLALVSLIALSNSLKWISSENEISGHRYWMFGVGCLAIASAILAQPSASRAWSFALILPGACLYFAFIRNRSILPVVFLSIVSISTLPFTPSWNGLFVYSSPFRFWSILLFFAQAVLFAGYLRFSLRESIPGPPPERWTGAIYWLGLLILPLTLIGISLSNQILTVGPGWKQSLLFLGIMGLSILIFFLQQRRFSFSARFSSRLRRFFSFEWLLLFLTWIYYLIGRLTAFISLIMEGEGGILWSILLFVLLITAFFITGANP